MNKLRGEQGAALVVTMFIITIMLLFVSAQLFQVTNTRKQVSTMEKKIMAEHMAEMGIDYYRALIQNIEQNPSQSREDYLRKIKNIPDNILEKQIITSGSQGNRSYEIEVTEVKDESDQIVIEFISIGTAYLAEKRLQSTIVISIIEN